MKRSFANSVLIAVAMLCIVTTVGGCQNATPVEKAYGLGTMYSQAQQEVITARTAGLIDDTQYNVIADANQTAAPLVKEALRSAVQAEQESVPWSKTFQFNKAYDAARNAVRVLLIRLAESQRQNGK